MLSYVIDKGGNHRHGKAAMQKLHCLPARLARAFGWRRARKRR